MRAGQRTRWSVTLLFGVAAAFTGAHAATNISHALAQSGTRAWLVALYSVLRTGVALAFAMFTVGRVDARKPSRSPVAFLACAAALSATAAFGEPGAATPNGALVTGDLVAVGFAVWLLVSALFLGRSFGVLPEARALVTRGPYRFSRHPVYLGEIGACVGLAIAAPSARNSAALLVVITAQLLRTRLEERALTEAFPHYADYARATPRLVPGARLDRHPARASAVVGGESGGALRTHRPLRRYVSFLALSVFVLGGVTATQAAIDAHASAKHRKKAAPKTVHGLRAPSLLTPSNGAQVQEIPALTWSAVSGASEYEYQLSADSRFRSIVLGTGPGLGASKTHNLAASLSEAVADGSYYWRVRALVGRKQRGPWSSTRRIVKRWTAKADLLGPSSGSAIAWPSAPLVLTWTPVASATEYIITIAADRALSNILVGSATSPQKTHGTVFALPRTLHEGEYYWAITPVDAQGHRGTRSNVGSFSWFWPTRTATRITPLNDPPGASELEWTPEFSWNPVPGAARYQVEVSSAEGFPAGSIWSNTTTIGTSYSPTVALNNNEYYWRVRAIDASGNAGVWNEGPRFIKTFDHQSPTISHLKMVDINENPTPAYPTTETPIVNWSPVFGAASYEVQVGRIQGDKYLITQPAVRSVTGDTITVIEPENERPLFTITANLKEGSRLIEVTKGSENLIPGRTGQKLSDKEKGLANGTALAGLVNYSCGPLRTFQTASTSWTPLESGGHIGQSNWPAPQGPTIGLTKGFSYCVSVAPISDKDAFGHFIEGALTPVGHLYEAAFTYDTRFDRCQRAHNFEKQAAELEAKGNGAEAAEEREDAEGIYKAYETLTPTSCNEILEYPEPASTTPSSAYRLPLSGTSTSRTPLFTWEPVLGATEYYVVIARNPQFTNVVDVAETYGNAYAPPLGNEEPLDDETTQYYWAVIPAKGGLHVGLTEANSPQSFNKSSNPPVLLAPSEGAVVVTQPTFKWKPVNGDTSDGALNYTLQVSQDPTFAKPLEEATTDSTAYTSSSTYPADSVLYWRVRANDANRSSNRKGLNWSAVQTFTRTLPVPAPAADNVTGSEAIPVRAWTPVTGAVAYDVHVELPNGTLKDYTLDSTAFTPTELYGNGRWHWEVRAKFPTSGAQTVPGPYFEPPQPFVHTLAPPTGAVGQKKGSRIVISWNPDQYAKQYEVDVSSNSAFGSLTESRRTYQTSWAPNIDLSRPANEGTLYWRVAAVEEGNNVGPYAEGRFGPPRPKAGCVVKNVKIGNRIVKKCAAANKSKRHG
jgi:protein-S-isoprenylcysteine O-methyltransferase Ste14